LHRTAGFPTCRIADFPIGRLLSGRARPVSDRSAGWETRDTADWEVCGTPAVAWRRKADLPSFGAARSEVSASQGQDSPPISPLGTLAARTSFQPARHENDRHKQQQQLNHPAGGVPAFARRPGQHLREIQFTGGRGRQPRLVGGRHPPRCALIRTVGLGNPLAGGRSIRLREPGAGGSKGLTGRRGISGSGLGGGGDAGGRPGGRARRGCGRKGTVGILPRIIGSIWIGAGGGATRPRTRQLSPGRRGRRQPGGGANNTPP